jgi:membrane-associated phospholipid phosphatase
MHPLAILTNPAVIGIVALFLSVVWMLRDQTDKTRPLLVFALTLNLFFGFLLTVFMSREGSLLPFKFDYVLAGLDGALGVNSGAVARPLEGVLRRPLIVVYELMVPMMICWFFVTRTANPRVSIVMAYVAELIAAPVLYSILPACGPIYAFGARWLHPPEVQAATIRLVGMPNAFPSLHVGTAFVFVLLAPGKLWRSVSIVFLAATGLATLSTGEHYIIDLVAGLLFGCFAASVGYGRFRIAAIYLGIVLGWSLAVRFGYAALINHPALLRSAAVLSVALAVLAVVREWSFRNAPSVEPAVAVS